MRRQLLMTAVLSSLLLSTIPPARAAGGKWSPDQLGGFDPAELRAMGLELPPGQLWDAGGGGLFEASVQIGGCTASFVSPRGLMFTNHHCVTAVLQSHSSPERDLLADGFLAAGPAEELPASAIRALLPHRFEDVSAAIEAAVPAGASDHQRFLAIDRKKKELVAACEKEGGGSLRCQVATFDDGVRYVLVVMREYPDVRLVWAPPAAVANFGGEIDNFSWPRHSGDAALLRVWAAPDGSPAPRGEGNVPLAPRRFYQINTKGLADGDFLMVAGYPSRTYRSTVHAEMEEWAGLYFPQRALLYRQFMDVLEKAGQESDDARIRVASRLRELANREKAARGQVAGIARGHLLAKKKEQEEAFRSWAAARPEEKEALAALDGLKAASAGRPRGDWQREYLLSEARAGSKSLWMALVVTRWALEREKPDAERAETFQERNLQRARDEQKRDQKTLLLPADRQLMEDYLEKLLELPEGYRVSAVESRFRAPRERAAMAKTLAAWLAETRIHDEDQRLAMLEESVTRLRERQDPLLDFAFELNREILATEVAKEERDGLAARLRPTYRRALARFLGQPLDADANATLRVSFARIAGYSPKDGLFATPRTTFQGLIAKNTGEPPFAAPAALLAFEGKAAASRWADARLGDLPIDFLADADTTGGNSGSPVLDGRGRLVGLNFDRVWENVANDFGYNPEIARNICVDIRYVFFLLDNLGGEAAQKLLAELGAVD